MIKMFFVYGLQYGLGYEKKWELIRLTGCDIVVFEPPRDIHEHECFSIYEEAVIAGKRFAHKKIDEFVVVSGDTFSEAYFSIRYPYYEHRYIKTKDGWHKVTPEEVQSAKKNDAVTRHLNHI